MRKENKIKSAHNIVLTKSIVIDVAIKIADAGGIEALSMRKLGRELGVEAMAIYHHFTDKNQLVEEMVDLVHKEIKIESNDTNWRILMHERANSAFQALIRHPWAPPIMEAGVNPGPSTLEDSERMIRCFREAGFSIEMTVHAVTILNIYVFGAAQQYVKLSFTTNEQAAEHGETIKGQFPTDAYPYLSEMIKEHMMKNRYSAMNEFHFGLNLILDSITKFDPNAQI